MAIRSIFLFAPAGSSSAGRGAAAYAIAMARSHDARLTTFCVGLDVTTPGKSTDAVAVGRSIAAAAQAAGVDCRLITEHSHSIGVHEVVAEHARLHDLSVTGADSFGLLSERQVAEHLMFASGRPVLLVPAPHVAGYLPGKVAAAWDNTPAAGRALGDAIALLDVSAVSLLTVEEEKQVRGDVPPEGLVAALARRGVAASYTPAKLGSRSIAEVLQQESARQDASLLVMGAFAHSRLRSFVLGSATRDVLDNCRMPVLLSH